MKNSRSLIIILLMAAASTMAYGQAKVTVTNPTAQLRHEVVEVDASILRKRMNITDSTSVVVVGTLGQQVNCQVTHDGRLLFEGSVLPNGKAQFTVIPGKPLNAKHYVQGAQYKQRLDDLTWENDLCAYRLYGPALQKRGERSFGIDVWTKSTPLPVVTDRYRFLLERAVAGVDRTQGMARHRRRS